MDKSTLFISFIEAVGDQEIRNFFSAMQILFMISYSATKRSFLDFRLLNLFSSAQNNDQNKQTNQPQN